MATTGSDRDVRVETIETSSLGDRSYLATDGERAVVVDPQRDVDRVLALAGQLGARIALVLETHIHNDYVSGGLDLARLTGADYGLAADDEAPFPHTPLRDGDVVPVSAALRVRALATPGHTFHHLSYVLESEAGAVGVFTGGSLLFGTTGRTDLLGPEHSTTLARHQHASAHRLADEVPDGARIWPTHGFGSFCSATPAGGDSATLGHERGTNPAFTLAEQDFVDTVLSGLETYPAYYAHMGVRNLAGPEPVDLRPPAAASPADLADGLARGEWIVDLRNRHAYAAAHLAGTVSLGLDGSLATWLGWLVDWGAPITLLGRSREQVAAAQRELARIGIDGFAGAATGEPADLATERSPVRSTRTADFGALAAALRGEPGSLPPAEVVLDVRTPGEFRAAHVTGAVHVPLYELRRRIPELPAGMIWVHCGSGYRATTAASLLEAAGRAAVVVDDRFDGAAAADVPLTSAGPAESEPAQSR
ncbi:MBL fold metallo-hydrolase [Salinifilum aidingensis]